MAKTKPSVRVQIPMPASNTTIGYALQRPSGRLQKTYDNAFEAVTIDVYRTREEAEMVRRLAYAGTGIEVVQVAVSVRSAADEE